MVKREIGVGGVVVYLIVCWTIVALLFVVMTRNGEPSAPVLAWAEEPLRTTTRLSVTIAQPSIDPDGDEVNYFYEWKKNGEPIDHLGNSWTSKETRKGDTFEAIVHPDDGTYGSWGCSLPWRECAGGAIAVLSGTIGNAPPRARVEFVDLGKPEDAEDRIIGEYGKKTDVGLALRCYDPDVIDTERDAAAEAAKNPPPPAPEGEEAAEPEPKPDPCTYTAKWYPLGEGAEEGAEGAAEGEAEEPEPFSTEMVLKSADARKAPAWRVVVVANDGEDDGEPVEALIYSGE